MADDQRSDTDMENTESSKAKKATTYTKEQREAITKVRKCGPKDYYGILGLEPSCAQPKITKAYKDLSRLIHPDKNKFSDATRAFKSWLL